MTEIDNSGPQQKHDYVNFKTWLDDEKDPKVMYVSIPVAGLAENLGAGTAMVRGVLDEVKGVCINIIQKRRLAAQIKNGKKLVMPPGVLPMPPNMKSS